MVSQSDVEPMMMPTSGLLAEALVVRPKVFVANFFAANASP
jgi:hypothetical protein